MNATVTLGQQGRLVIPAEVREALGFQPGDQLRLTVTGQSVLLERPEDARAALRGMFPGIPGRSVVDELLAERRLAAAAGD